MTTDQDRLLVFDGVEEEAAGRRRGASESAIVRCEDVRDVVELQIAAADIEHSSDEVANHMVQKSVAAHTVDKESATITHVPAPF